MGDLVSKLSSYNLFNYLLPGVLFAAIADRLTPYRFLQDDLIAAFFVYYFIGLVISRIGSIIIEPIFKYFKFVTFVEYDKFVLASNNDKKIDELSEANNMYRTLCTMFILVILLYAIGSVVEVYPKLSSLSAITGLVALLILFVFAYRKQTAYVVNRVKTVCEKIE